MVKLPLANHNMKSPGAFFPYIHPLASVLPCYLHAHGQHSTVHRFESLVPEVWRRLEYQLSKSS